MRPYAIAGVLVAVALFVALGIWAVSDYNSWKDSCVARGGHVDSHTDWRTTYDSQGKSHYDSNTTYYCISNDGRILGIR